jgi:WD40 repeat protein
MNDEQTSGIVIGSVGGDLSLRAGGDIVAGNKTIINNIIQRIAKELTTTPYKFLASYEIADRDIFYGRDAIIEELAAQVGRHKFILINGASGAGKSSLVNAGLIPRVADNGYTFVAFREYSDPLAQLQAYFDTARSPSPPQSPAKVADAQGSLLQLIRGFGAFPIVIFLDQFERFFVRVADDKRHAFIAAFNHCLQHSEAKDLCFVLAFRREFLGQLTTEFEEQIPEFLNEAYRINLLPLSKAEAREAVLRPLENTSLRIQYDEDFVDDVLLAGLAEQAGGASIDPPHLQIVCNQLFEAARQRLQTRPSALINRALYDELGGAEKILNTYLDKVVEDVAQDPARIAVVHSILKTMVDAGTNTRSFVAMEGFKRTLPDVNEAEILRFIDKLLDRRVVEERKPAYSLSHEHMVGKVREWFDPRELERKRAEETLDRGMMEWKNSGALLNRGQVERIRKWLPDPAAEEHELLQASEKNYREEERKEAARQKLKRISLYGAAAFTVLVMMLGAYSWFEKVAAVRAAKLATSGQWAAQTLTDLDVRAPRNLLLALNSISLTRQIGAFSPTQSRQLLSDLLSSTGGLPLQHAAPVAAIGLSPDDRWLAAASAGEVQLWDMRAPAATPNTLSGHNKVNKLAFSPDGRTLATVGDDGTLRLWDMAAADRAAGVRVLTGHSAPIVDVAFSPNGRWLATASTDRTARLWDLAASDPATASLILPHEEAAEVNSLAFSRNEHWLATGSWDGTNGMIRLWDLLSPNPSARPILVHVEGTDVRKVAFSPNSQWLVAGATETYKVLLMHVTTPNKPFFLEVSQWVEKVAFSPDGRWLATPSQYDARLWDLNKPDPVSEPLILPGHKDAILDLAFAPDGSWFATGSRDHTVQLWNTADRFTLSAVLRGHEGSISGVAFSSDGRRLATASEDRTVRLWNTSSPVAEPLVLRAQDGSTELHMWDLRSVDLSTAPRILGDKLDQGAGSTLSADGKWLATISADIVHLWNLSTPSPTQHVVPHDGRVWASPVFSPDGRWLATGGADHPTIRLWDLKVPDPMSSPRVLHGHRGPVRSLAISADGHRLVSGANDGVALVWDLTAADPSANPVRLPGGGGTSIVHPVAISGDGRYVVTGSWEPDYAARIWDLSLPISSSSPVTLTFKGRVFDVAFSTDGRWVAAGSWDQTTQLLDLTKPDAKPTILQGHTARTLSVAFSPDSQWLATGNEDRTARLWSLAAADPSADSVVLRAPDKVGNVSFSPDGRWLALNQTEYRSSPFSPDGFWFVSTAIDTRLYHMRLEDLVLLACRTAGRNLAANELRKGNVPLDLKICSQGVDRAQPG